MPDKKVAPLKKEYRAEAGVLEWFHKGDYEMAERAIEDLRELGIRHLRTGISWADLYTEGGQAWYDWLLPRLAKNLTLLPCFLYTPPSIGIAYKTSSPPVDPKAYADELDKVLTRYGEHFEYIELWNEPNNLSEWDWRLDPGWKIFSEMIGMAAHWAKRRGKKTVLAGMSPIDAGWLDRMFQRGLDNIDVIGIHGFPDSFETVWSGWDKNISDVREVLKKHESDARLWITETGFSTWQHDERRQLEEFMHVSSLPVDRFYWFSLRDLNPMYSTVDGFHLDEREYRFGLKHHGGRPKLLYRMLAKHGPEEIRRCRQLTRKPVYGGDEKTVLITGGAGFVGTNLAAHYLEQGRPVTIFDNLSREGVEDNLAWLVRRYGKDVRVDVADIRNEYAVLDAVKRADRVFHFAAQVAVTSSIADPVHDFEVNARGTLNLLKAAQALQSPVPFIYTSTNKVYGGFEDLGFAAVDGAYRPVDPALARHGVSESRPTDFHSPYGCSKGTADQYVIDYARTFNLPAAVFRMSCIYGPHQYGTEDQGWVAHFARNLLSDLPVTIYGDGMQVRDILYIGDLVEAFSLAERQIDNIAGEAFNIGGGPGNAVSVLGVVRELEKLYGVKADIRYGEWRAGDQRYYVSDTRKFSNATGWSCRVPVAKGLPALCAWLEGHRDLPAPRRHRVMAGQ